MLNKRYIKSIKRDSFCFDFLSSILVSIFFVSTSFLVNIGKEMSLPGFRTNDIAVSFCLSFYTLLLHRPNVFPTLRATSLIVA